MPDSPRLPWPGLTTADTPTRPWPPLLAADPTARAYPRQALACPPATDSPIQPASSHRLPPLATADNPGLAMPTPAKPDHATHVNSSRHRRHRPSPARPCPAPPTADHPVHVNPSRSEPGPPTPDLPSLASPRHAPSGLHQPPPTCHAWSTPAHSSQVRHVYPRQSPPRHADDPSLRQPGHAIADDPSLAQPTRANTAPTCQIKSIRACPCPTRQLRPRPNMSDTPHPVNPRRARLVKPCHDPSGLAQPD
jgi:hypothetical protein